MSRFEYVRTEPWIPEPFEPGHLAKGGRFARGRAKKVKSPTAKLTEDCVRSILKRRPEDRKAGALSKELAQEFGVSESCIMRVWRRQTFSHVRLEE